MELKSLDEFKFILKNTKNIIVIDFFADWCIPCKKLEPEYFKLSEKFSKFNFYKINIENTNFYKLMDICKIESLPSFCIFHNSEFILKTTNFIELIKSLTNIHSQKIIN